MNTHVELLTAADEALYRAKATAATGSKLRTRPSRSPPRARLVRAGSGVKRRLRLNPRATRSHSLRIRDILSSKRSFSRKPCAFLIGAALPRDGAPFAWRAAMAASGETFLDLPTLGLVAIGLADLLGLFLVFCWLQDRAVRALAWWGCAYFIGAFSLTFMAVAGFRRWRPRKFPKP